MAQLVARWVRRYTRNLPPAVAERRIGEIDADLHDHIVHERARGIAERRIAAGVAGRMLRGMPADASWRARTLAGPLHRSLVRVGLATGVILLVPLVANLTTDGPGWGVFDFVFAAALLGGTGLLLELAARNGSSVVYRVVVVAIGAAAVVLGEMDDAPGLMLFGFVFIGGAVALTFRTARSSE